MWPCSYDHRELDTGSAVGATQVALYKGPPAAAASMTQQNLCSKISRSSTTQYSAHDCFFRNPHCTQRCKKYGQASRLISTSQLNVSLRLHIWPIDLVIFQESLGALWLGRSHLVEGFTLRCLQRFSLPDVATRHCHWRDNRYTRGPSNPVLSY